MRTEVEFKNSLAVVVTEKQTEPDTLYETGNYSITDLGHVSDFEHFRYAKTLEEARVNHEKLVDLIRDTAREESEERTWRD